MKKVLLLCMCLLVLTSGCKGATDPVIKDEPASTEETTAVSIDIPKTEEEESSSNEWIIQVKESKQGNYTIPGTGKNFDFKVDLLLFAWKDGGDTPYGKYKGQANTIFYVDESKLSDEDLIYTGGFMFDRTCEEMEFEILPYDLEEYKKIEKTTDLDIGIAPLIKPDGMSSFISQWTSVSIDEQTIIDNDTGKVYYQGDGSEKGDGQSYPMGINILTEGDSVTVDIPTINAVWKLDFFRGSIKKAEKGTKEKERERYIALLKEEAEEKKANAAENVIPSDSGIGEIENVQTGEDGILQFKNENGGVVIVDDDGMRIDTDGDGKIDTWISDNETKIDTDADGIPDTTYDNEYSEGALSE